MRLTHLSLSNFRNFTRLDTRVPGGPILLVGENAQGKTSLLEAIYYLATLDSFHASSDRQLINFIAARDPQAVARIVAVFERGGRSHRLEVRIIQENSGQNGGTLRKEVLLDGSKLKVGEAVGQMMAVLFLPHMLSIIDGAPEERRRYLNLALAQVLSYYPAALSDYQRVLTQRNALLKQLAERSSDRSELAYWNEQLASTGAQIIHARIAAVQELERLARPLHDQLTRSEEVLRLSYQPAYDPMPRSAIQFALPLDAPVDRSSISLEQIRSGFITQLERLADEEIARGVTTIGPHRDELRVISNGHDLGLYGSRGQIRTAMLSLKLAEVEWMHQKTGHWPILLLDEVLAELDTRRRADLLGRLAVAEQALMTTTDLDLFPADFIRQTSLWRIRDGRLVEEVYHATA
jgi:DNA replication and repair protein RecF